MPMQNILLLAEVGTLGVCPCRIYYFWQNWERWACVHAEFITLGRTWGIGRVPMQNLLLLAELGALQGYASAKSLAALAGKFRPALAGKFPIIPKGYSWLVEQLLVG